LRQGEPHGLPPVRFDDLRHGAARMLLAVGQPVKVVSEILGHSTVSLTMDVYAVVAEKSAEAAAVAIATSAVVRATCQPAERRGIGGDAEVVALGIVASGLYDEINAAVARFLERLCHGRHRGRPGRA